MKNQINTEAEATRLAQAICADIELYQREALSAEPAGAAVQAALREGFGLYQARTSPALRALFITAAEARFFGGLSTAQQDALHAALEAPSPAAPIEAPSSRLLWWVALFALFAALWVLLGR